MAIVRKHFFLAFLFSITPLIAWTNQGKLRLEVDGKIQPVTGSIELNSDYHNIILFFPSQSENGIHYQFYLNGLEKKWQHSVHPLTRYTNLSGGQYQFILQVWQGNEKLSEHTAAFIIKQDFWERWWFSLFAAIVGLSFISIIIYFWFLYDFRQRMKVQEIRQRIAADLHDEVGANLSSITFIVELLLKKLKAPDSELKPLIEKISRNSRETATLINDTIWALNPDYDSIEKLIEKMKSFAAEILASRDIALTFNSDSHFRISLSIDQRRDIYLIFKEAVNNTAKHSGANQVIISISEKIDSLEISVNDNGKGFDPVKTYEGNGLKNYSHRSRSGEVVVKIESRPGNGTTIRINTKPQYH